MALRKVIGTETEYGIAVRSDPDFNPALGSAMVVNSYPGPRVRVQWSYEEETPGRDARGFGHEGYGISDPEGTLVNAVLANGARLYVDHAHPEYSAPESWDPLEAALYDKAGEGVMRRAAVGATERLGGTRLALYKNNSDGKGNSYGAHENYLLSRATPFGDVIRYAMTFLVTRQLFTGAGKVGSENGRPAVDYQITQRADFFEEEVGLETTLKRPIVNTRDEPHGDPTKYRRLHVIVGDANLSEVQIFLKLGTTALILAALEDGALPDPLDLADPVSACWNVSHDLTFRRPLDLDGGGSATALELQWRYLEWLTKYVEKELDEPVWNRVLTEWEGVLADLEEDPALLADRLDWAAKRRLFERYVDRDGISWSDNKLRALDLQYHDVDPERGLYHRLAARGDMRRLFSAEELAAAESTPPERTRAYFRGRCVTDFPDSLVAANWDSLVFDLGEAHLRRVPMMEPLRGSRDLVGPLLDRVDSASQLIQLLGDQ
ncbi:MAG TPA: depupylase/deamidase Dop [Acidimicrobiia bacterium]|jgi:proteasome accessory factor A|nr:depupylase/deamidase Dop [Acidimicrobiia bacterium]